MIIQNFNTLKLLAILYCICWKCIFFNYLKFWIWWNFNTLKLLAIWKSTLTDLCHMWWNRNFFNRWIWKRISLNSFDKWRNSDFNWISTNKNKSIIFITFNISFAINHYIVKINITFIVWLMKIEFS